ncbi:MULTISPECIES: ATP-dependent Clp protease proteolytic subunit, partial [unclassified Enterococcus]
NVGTSLMIHEASTFAWGNKQDIQKTLNALETIDDSILAIYSDKTGQSADQLREWMNEEKWFTADEAVE